MKNFLKCLFYISIILIFVIFYRLSLKEKIDIALRNATEERAVLVDNYMIENKLPTFEQTFYFDNKGNPIINKDALSVYNLTEKQIFQKEQSEINKLEKVKQKNINSIKQSLCTLGLSILIILFCFLHIVSSKEILNRKIKK